MIRDNASSIIRVENLTAKYDEETVLNSISFQVYAGEIFLILGGSGSGKTTLLRHMLGLIEPEEGLIWINGDQITHATDEQRHAIFTKIGVVYQSGALFGSMPVLENVSLPLEEFTDLSPEAIDAIAKNKLNLVGLGHAIHMMPGELSGGMQKRAAIARALALDPKILFLDEPSAGLDPITSAQLDQFILELSKLLGCTFVIVSHELSSIFTIADRCILLHDGKILAEGNPKELRKRTDHPWMQSFFNREAIRETS